VGTGYFLDKCRFPSSNPRIALVDLNPNSLSMTAKRLRRYHPTRYLANVLEPLQLHSPQFDSIAINYILHCLPGTMQSKQAVFGNLKSQLNPNGIVFGTSILGQGIHPNFLARRLMTLYNDKSIFSNHEDSLEDLEAGLRRYFQHYWTKVIGCVAFFVGRK
jgi:ubiquinone/menaquinone biosynthesis C-methylase UbiE